MNNVKIAAEIVTLIPHYLPGHKMGGPVKSISSLVDAFGNDMNMSILTSDRDLQDELGYSGIKIDTWIPVSHAKVMYLDPGFRGIRRLCYQLRLHQGKVLYVNGAFTFGYSIVPLVYIRVMRLKYAVIIAPRGEFSAGALQFRKVKKQTYLLLTRLMSLFKGVIWHSSSPHESEDIRRIVPGKLSIFEALNVSHSPIPDNNYAPRDPGEHLRVVFLSRIVPKKNLDYALDILSTLKSTPVKFTIIGTIEDQEYWKICGEKIRLLPSNINVKIVGDIHPSKIPDLLVVQDVMLFPTHGENFGHVIAESLSVGTPVVISNTTPWVNLEKSGLGHDIPLNEKAKFAEILEKYYRKNKQEQQQVKRQVIDGYAERVAIDKTLNDYKSMFEYALTRINS